MTRTLRLFLGIVILGIAGLAMWKALPLFIGRLPNVVQQNLPHEVRALVSTPLPSALPAPEILAETTAVIVIPTLVPSETTTAIPSATHQTNHTPHPSATASPSPTPLPTSTPLPASAHIDGLVIDPQGFNNCGPTNLSIVLAHHGYTADQDTIAEFVRPAYEDKNVSPLEMAAYVNEQTPLKAIALWGGDLPLLKQLLVAGFPVIIEEGLLPSEWEG